MEVELANLSMKVDASSHQGSQSRARWLQSMERNKILQTQINFFVNFGLEACQKSAELEGLLANGSIDDFSFSLQLTEEPRNEKGSRAHFGEVVRKVILPESREHCCESRNTPTVGTFKPDYLLRQSGRGGEHSIVVVGEIKSMAATKEAEFPDEEVGQILDFLKELLMVQGWRHWAFGFITDTFRFEFFRAVRGPNNVIHFERSTLLTGASGWLHLNNMINETNEKLGFVPIDVAGWTLDKWLGSGATASVFAASSQHCPSAVCKVYLGQRKGLRSNEVRALDLMKQDPSSPNVVDNSPGVTQAGTIEVLLVTPQGKPLGAKGIRVPIKTFSIIVDTLKTSHSATLCHCDVCPQNMFAVETPDGDVRIILNDWGSSKLLSEIVGNGDVEIYTHHIFNNANAMGHAQDLAALVRSVFALTQLTFDIDTVKSFEQLDSILRAQWHWGDALDSALKTDYSAVKLFFETGSTTTLCES
jgi:hypothetical protein